jgi:hypothetical protein
VHEVLNEASAALDEWLAFSLEDTDEDWVPYLERLESDHLVDLQSDTTLARRFEAFARDELRSWSPSPPDIELLLAHANKFGSADLIAIIEETIEEDRIRDEEEGKSLLPRTPTSKSPNDEESDDTLRDLFRRLARR